MKIRASSPGAQSFSHGGKTYEAGEDGLFEVESHVEVAMRSHGFVPASDPLPPVGPTMRDRVVNIMKELGIEAPVGAAVEELVKIIHETVSGTKQSGGAEGTSSSKALDPGTGDDDNGEGPAPVSGQPPRRRR
jgi:hypothetical protein